jgi:hypothetical protein
MNLVFNLNAQISRSLSKVKPNGAHRSGTPRFQFPTTCQLVHILLCDFQSRNSESQTPDHGKGTEDHDSLFSFDREYTGNTKVRITVAAPIIEITHPNSFRTIPLSAIPPPIGISEMKATQGCSLIHAEESCV